MRTIYLPPAFFPLVLTFILSAATSFGDESLRAADPIIKFEDQPDAPKWTVVNDGVMGGLSKGSLEMADGKLFFSGTLSLENNGGFSLVETSGSRWDLSDATGLRIRVKGDGRTYQLRLGTDALTRGDRIAYSADFDTQAGEWVERVIPFNSLRATHHGESIEAPPVNTANIEQIGILIGDKRPGPFQIQVDWIAAAR